MSALQIRKVRHTQTGGVKITEHEKHLILKDKMFKELKKEGFTENEIFFEYKVPDMIVDIVGISENKRVAIEVGNLTNPAKIEELSKHFDKVIYLPYIVKTPEYRSSVKASNTEIREIKTGKRCRTSLVLQIPKKFNFHEGDLVWLLKHGEKIIIEKVKITAKNEGR